ncbi:MAG: ABC transporter ATP-binding protein [Rubrivivax sp.]
MAAIELRDLRKRFGSTDVLRGIGLRIEDGEFVVFVGPSGCGKSTLLRTIAGLESADAGQVLVDGQDVSHAPPSARRMAMVFQSYALYPHMSVRDNLSFGMRMRGVPRADIDTRLARAARMLRLEPLLERRPGELSGGQCQRVAIGRALVQEPGAFLLDEPLSNLDAELRLHMRLEIAALHRELGTTFVHVTHDQVEAMTMAQRIVVLRDGCVEQVGAPMALYERPVNRFVAGFIGSPAMNLLPVRFEPAGQALQARIAPTGGDTAGQPQAAGPVVPLPHAPGALVGSSGHVGVRPEHLRLHDAADGLDDPVAPSLGQLLVRAVERPGASAWVHGTLAGTSLALCVEQREGPLPQPGELMGVRPVPGRLHLFDAQDRRVDTGDRA